MDKQDAVETMGNYIARTLRAKYYTRDEIEVAVAETVEAMANAEGGYFVDTARWMCESPARKTWALQSIAAQVRHSLVARRIKVRWPEAS